MLKWLYGNTERNWSISELYSEEVIVVYPYPAGDWLRVSASDKLGQATLTIWGVRGKELRSFEVKLSPHADIDMESLCSGLYFFQVKAEYFIHTVRFMKFWLSVKSVPPGAAVLLVITLEKYPASGFN